ncbi:MAG: phosphoglycerate kinase [Alphaproteobacteria bacterium]|nr:phosphoglycerate kinase [Alphaproteobacteria bacterium]OJV46439.1 MAG: phosphoglycerate kinase [Alphaproteobacteria bacterium 43-37]
MNPPELENLDAKKVLVRADLNLPYHDGQFGDLTRLERFLPTLNFLRKKGAIIFILSHFGRPKGKRDAHYTLSPLAKTLSNFLNHPVRFVSDCIGPSVEMAIGEMKSGDVALLENVRFYAEEENNDFSFAEELSANMDIYINDAFSVSHRAHASVDAITKHLPSFMGPQFHAEVQALHMALENPERPCAAIVGGSKISTKIALLKNLTQKVDYLILGGGMANTFLHFQGHDIGASLIEEDSHDVYHSICEVAKVRNCQILLPNDVQVAHDLTSSNVRTIQLDQLEPVDKIFDIGLQTLTSYEAVLKICKTVLWNGPMGVFEVPPYDYGTTQLARIVARLTQESGLISVAGGGDTAAALAHAGVQDKFTYISAAGGAFLEWLEGKDLPGMQALKNAMSQNT